MNVALIKNGVCENVAVFESLESAKSIFGDKYDSYAVIEEENYNVGIGDKYTDEDGWEYMHGEMDEGGILYTRNRCPICNTSFSKDGLVCKECGFNVNDLL